MRLRTMFGTLAVMLVIAGVWMAVVADRIDSVMFYFAEGFIALAFAFVVYFYVKVIRSINAVVNGMDLLNEQDFSSKLARVGQSDTDRIIEVFNRMMSKLKTERLYQQEQNYFLDLIIKNSPMGVIILDLTNKVMAVNASAVRFLGVTKENNIYDLSLDKVPSPLAVRLNELKPGKAETIRVGNAMIYRCTLLSFADRGFHHPFILIESLTEEVMKAEKKAYEKVIRMIAHEVNNTIAGVTSSLDSLGDVLGEMEKTEDLQDVMRVCVERCYGLSNFITRFAGVIKIPDPILREENLNDCVSRCKKVMENLCNERNITLETNLYPESIPVAMDISLIEQVLVNIIKNSAESIGENGKIFITTNTTPAPMVEIADNGKGIDNETAGKLFTPFFSTKPNGQGLGLIFIREVLMKHDCRFSLLTGKDGITRFTISF